MAKYISIFFLTVSASVLVLIIVGYIFSGTTAEDIFRIVYILLFSFVITQLYYIIHLIKQKR
jgi:hypothetical protein